jgi:hypothetical protein
MKMKTKNDTERVSPPMTEERILLHKVAQKVFEEASTSNLGLTFHIIISFHLKQKFGKDPYEVLVDDPKTFFNGLEEVLGAGAEAVICLIGTFLVIRYGVNCTTDEFVRLLIKGDEPSKRRLKEILIDVAHSSKEAANINLPTT